VADCHAMTSAPCTGPCNVGLGEFIGYTALLLAAVAVLLITYGLSQGIARRLCIDSRIVPLVVGAVAVLLTVVLTTFALDQIARHSWPTVVVGRIGLAPSDPIALGGNYAVDWRAISGDAGCQLDARLRGTDDDAYSSSLVSASVPPRTNTGGATIHLVAVGRTRYFVDASSDCAGWSITFTPE
jgi:hypothetical protein